MHEQVKQNDAVELCCFNCFVKIKDENAIFTSSLCEICPPSDNVAIRHFVPLC